MGNVYLLGADSHIWEEFDPAELLCIQPTKPDTWVAQFITNKLIQRYHHLVGRFFRVRISLLPGHYIYLELLSRR